jgi:hypothetical protein
MGTKHMLLCIDKLEVVTNIYRKGRLVYDSVAWFKLILEVFIAEAEFACEKKRGLQY